MRAVSGRVMGVILWANVLSVAGLVVKVEEKYKGEVIAHDASPVLFAAALQDPKAAVENRTTEPMKAYVRGYIKAWLATGTKVFMVGDGRRLPAKIATAERAQLRAKHLAAARKAEAKGDDATAAKEYKGAGCIPPGLTHYLRALCMRGGHGFVCAPYEADFQLIEMVKSGICVAATSGSASMKKGDSDLVVIGDGSVPILYQFHWTAGTARLIEPTRHIVGSASGPSIGVELLQH